MSVHVKVLAESHMSSRMIRYTLISDCLKKFLQWTRIDENKQKSFKVCHCTVGWMTQKLNNHDMIMVSFGKAYIDFPR